MTLEQLADQFIEELKERAYGVPGAGNDQEGDLGTWDDWRGALIEFAKRASFSA